MNINEPCVSEPINSARIFLPKIPNINELEKNKQEGKMADEMLYTTLWIFMAWCTTQYTTLNNQSNSLI